MVMPWRMLDLFSGIGGFALAAQWCWGDDLEIVSFVEIDKFCQKVLKKHWPDVPIIEDVRNVTKETLDDSECGRRDVWRTTDFKQTKGNDNLFKNSGTLQSSRLNLLTGGFPCQPFSNAGRRKGKADDRYLWPQMLRVISEVRPCWVIGENVGGITSMVQPDSDPEVEDKAFVPQDEDLEYSNVLSGILDDLERIGYTVQAFVIPACAVNAPHRRDRVWIVAYSDKGNGRRKLQGKKWESMGIEQSGQDVADTQSRRQQKQCESESTRSSCPKPERGSWWTTEPNVGRVAHGVPSRVDRLKSLGNAIVPQVAYQIMRAIKEVENGRHPD